VTRLQDWTTPVAGLGDPNISLLELH
jgi:hypothetical protein